MSEFRGFVFDIDNTAIPMGAATVESQALRDAFLNLPEDVIAIAATGRDPESALPIIQALGLKHESIVANGALIINSQTGKTQRERFLSIEQVDAILNIYKSQPYRVRLIGDPLEVILTAASQIPRQTAGVFICDIPANEAREIYAQAARLPDINAYLAPAWRGGKNEFDISIGHTEARKHNALKTLLDKYEIDASRMIAIGDGHNDLDLFSIVGHRVAVANAHPSLLEQADEVVSSQQDDGLAEVVRRFSRSE